MIMMTSLWDYFSVTYFVHKKHSSRAIYNEHFSINLIAEILGYCDQRDLIWEITLSLTVIRREMTKNAIM
jgi:hypothetical protein